MPRRHDAIAAHAIPIAEDLGHAAGRLVQQLLRRAEGVRTLFRLLDADLHDSRATTHRVVCEKLRLRSRLFNVCKSLGGTNEGKTPRSQAIARRRNGKVYGITLPPLGSIVWPVMKLFCGLARNNAAAATSSTRPMRAIGIISSFLRHSGDMLARSSMSVSIGPGAIALIKMSGANSLAQDFVRLRIAAFDAQ